MTLKDKAVLPYETVGFGFPAPAAFRGRATAHQNRDTKNAALSALYGRQGGVFGFRYSRCSYGITVVSGTDADVFEPLAEVPDEADPPCA